MGERYSLRQQPHAAALSLRLSVNHPLLRSDGGHHHLIRRKAIAYVLEE